MILSNIVDITMNRRYVNFYRKMGYICEVGKISKIEINDVLKGSHVLIDAKCDICDSIKRISYKVYNKSIKNGGYYSCSKICSDDKIVKTCINRYGNKNPNQLEEIKNKIKSINIEKYGVDHPMLLELTKKKIKETSIKKYGVKNPFQSEEIKNKIKETNTENYGVDNPSKSLSIKIKKQKTYLSKYGVDSPMKSQVFKEASRNTRIENGNQIPDYLLSDFEIYEKEVRLLTNSNKKILFENWDGYDYYDGEYIKNNLTLYPHNAYYPSIDHKVSILHGFINNIPSSIISNFDNLCITKRNINSKKGKMTEVEFLKKYKRGV